MEKRKETVTDISKQGGHKKKIGKYIPSFAIVIKIFLWCITVATKVRISVYCNTAVKIVLEVISSLASTILYLGGKNVVGRCLCKGLNFSHKRLTLSLTEF